MFWTSILACALAANVQSLPPGPGKEIVQQDCAKCHALKVVTSKRASRQQWSAVIDQMITRGADIADEDVETVVDYLAKNFGLDQQPAGTGKNHGRTKPVNVNSANAVELAAALGLSTKESASIVAYREQNGNFKEWRDLTKVPGINRSKIESNKNRFVF
jgi:competence ComEA-like helix-hairpin-helix protein